MVDQITIGIEDFSAAFVNTFSDPLIGFSPDGEINFWNKAAEKVYGYKQEEILGSNLKRIIPLDKREDLKIISASIFKSEPIKKHETVHLTKGAERIKVLLSTFPLHSDDKISAYGMHISTGTEISSESENLELYEKYRSLIETSPDAILFLDPNGNISMNNRQFPLMLGMSTIDEAYGENIYKFIAEESRISFEKDFKNTLETGKLNYAQYNLISKDGRSIPVEVNSSLVFDLLGKPEAVSMVIRDITQRKEAEKILHQSERQFRSVWLNSNDGMRLTDKKGKTIAVNKAFCELVGIEEIDLLGKPFKYIYKYQNRDEEIESVKRYNTQFTAMFNVRRQFQAQFRNGKKADLDVTYSIIEFEQGKPLLLGIFHDITDQKRSERELREAEKLATIGKMAAYLSHEIKTPLASIKANIDMLGKRVKMSPKKAKSYEIVQREVKRLDKLLKDVLQFARETELVFAPISLKDLFNYILELHQPTFEDKEINFSTDVGEIKIQGDYQKLYTLFLHLIENSIEAIGYRGNISAYAEEKENSVSVFIKDSGCGIEKPEKIFEPFYTGKVSGTGLGLAIVMKIIDQHKAEIKLVSSQPGETIFELVFPK